MSRRFTLVVNWSDADGGYTAFQDPALKRYVHRNLLKGRNLIATDPRKTPFRVDGKRPASVYLYASSCPTYKRCQRWKEILCTEHGARGWLKSAPCWFKGGQSRKKLFVHQKSNACVGGFGTYLVALWSGSITRAKHLEWVQVMRKTFGNRPVYCHNEDVDWFHVKEHTGTMEQASSRTKKHRKKKHRHKRSRKHPKKHGGDPPNTPAHTPIPTRLRLLSRRSSDISGGRRRNH
jgi:hypothetical protein